MKFLRLLAVFALTGFVFTSCQKEIDYGTGAPATGTLKATSGDCLPVTIYGTYQKDTLLNFSNTVDIQIDVATFGKYTIKTDTINGYSFSATGYAGVLGVNTVHLQASGRPILPEVDVFNVAFDTSHCQINVIVTGTGPATPGTITATIGSTATTFDILDTAVIDNTSFPGYTILDISGEVAATSELIDFGVGIQGTVITPGTYDVAGTGIPYFAYGDYNDGLTDFSAMTTGTNPTPTFTITITSITPTRVTGTFQGALSDGGTPPVIKTITLGSFSVPR